MGRSDTKLYFGLTEAGKIILRGIGFIALAAVVVPAFGVLSALASVILTGLIIGFILRPKVHLSSNLPDRVAVNHPVQLKYSIKNIGRFPVYNLSVRFEALPDTIEPIDSEYQVPRLGSGDAAEVTITIKPVRRGHYRIKQPICQSSFPFKLFSFGRKTDEQEHLIVLPSFSLLRNLPRHLQPKNHYDSSIPARRTGAFPEYMGSRPFLPGDSRRRIDVRAWARLAAPATKEYHENLDNSAALVLDTSMSGAMPSLRSGYSKEFEAAVSLCASVAYTINNQCLIDSFVAGPNLHQFVNWPKNKRLEKIHDILAGIEPSVDYTPDYIVPVLSDLFRKISEVIFVLPRWSKASRRLLEITDWAGCQSTVFIIGESDEIDLDEHKIGWTENIRILTPDQVVSEKVIHS